MIARLYARTYPADVAGILLIEPAHEDKNRLLEPYIPRRKALLGGLPRAPEQYPGKMPPLEAFAVELRNSAQELSVPVIALASIQEERLESLSETRRAGYRVERRLWQEVVSRSPDPELILYENSGHHPEREEPELVIGAVRRLLDKVASAGG
jgi:pimeloyl-ACP methyl ester carboxylesterase